MVGQHRHISEFKLYAYCMMNPVVLVDPAGTWWVLLVMVVAINSKPNQHHPSLATALIGSDRANTAVNVVEL